MAATSLPSVHAAAWTDRGFVCALGLGDSGFDVSHPPFHPPPHTEARKSPVVDGKVQRAADGKELRFPVLLSPQV